MKKVIAGVLIFLCVLVLCSGYFLVKERSKNTQSKEVELTEVQMITTKDLTKDYPQTPREVVKLYNRIITAYYGEDYSDEEFDKMIDQARSLFDDELAANNEKATYKSNVADDISDYKKNHRKIASSDVSDTDDVVYKTKGDEKLAYVDASYFVREGSTYTRSYQEFVLRQDSEGQWKILGFYQIKPKESTEE